MKIILGTLGCIAVAAGAYYFWPDQTTEGDTQVETSSPDSINGGIVEVKLPTSFSVNAQMGKRAFDAKCAACHNVNATGRDGVAPPLIHKIYEPSHHGDESFQRAAANGVRSHHWPFGDMPPVDGLTRADVQMIVTYVREIQRENGIN